MKVGVLAASISRRAGGLFWSVRSLARCSQAAGCDISVFSPADEFSVDDLGQWQPLDVRVFPRLGPAAFGYAPRLAAALEGSGADLVHTHGLWMYPSLAAWRWSRRQGRPIVVSPRGMLDPWAVCNSAWKKRVAGALFEHPHLRRAACLHALCEAEYQAIRVYGLRNPVAIIPNGIDLPNKNHDALYRAEMADRPGDSRVLLFLSRIHPKKGLPNLLRAWALARQGQPQCAAPWRLVIAGWEQDGHQGELQRLTETLGLLASVQFVGPQYDERKAAMLATADAFVLPSLSEGLPMAVLEAWSYGLPALITPGCNLPEGLAEDAALEMVPEVESIAAALRRLFAMSDLERRAMGGRGRRLVEQRFTWPRVAEQMCGVYRWVLGQGPRPACIVTD